jgi:hypothetical protein
MWASITHYDGGCNCQLPTFKPQGQREGKRPPWSRPRHGAWEIPNLKFSLPEMGPLGPFDSCHEEWFLNPARLGNPLETTRHKSIVEISGVFI